MRGVENDLGVELQQCAVGSGGKFKAKPKTILPSSPHFYPSSAHFYLNQHVACSNDRMNWWNATITRIDPAAHVLELQLWDSGVRL